MTLADTMLATMMFEQIIGPMQRTVNIFNNTIEMNDSIKRVQDFLECKDKQENVVLRKEDPSKEQSVAI